MIFGEDAVTMSRSVDLKKEYDLYLWKREAALKLLESMVYSKRSIFLKNNEKPKTTAHLIKLLLDETLEEVDK